MKQQAKIRSLRRRIMRLTDDLHRNLPLDQTVDVSGQVAVSALLAIKQSIFWKDRPIEPINDGQGTVEALLCGDDKPDRGFRMSNLPMMNATIPMSTEYAIPSAEDEFGPGARLRLSAGCDMAPSFGQSMSLRKWKKKCAFNVLLPYGSESPLDFFPIERRASLEVSIRAHPLPDETEYPELVLVKVMYEDVLTGVRNALGAHMGPPKGNLTSSKMVGWLAQSGPWATRIYINALACHLGMAVGRGMGLEIDPVSAQLVPFQDDDSIPWGLLLWGDKTPGVWGSDNIVVCTHPTRIFPLPANMPKVVKITCKPSAPKWQRIADLPS